MRGGDDAASDATAAEALRSLVAAELARPLDPRVARFAERLAAPVADAVESILFYGSALRHGRLDGVLDFYVLTNRPVAWPGSRLAAWASRLLPPGVGYAEGEFDGVRLRAKYAVMEERAFADGMRRAAFDTTLWARFSQPFALVRAGSEAARQRAVAAGVEAVTTAAAWAAVLGPARGTPEAYWQALYAETYGAELRVESGERSVDLLAGDRARYDAALPLAWRRAGLAFDRAGDTLRPELADAVRRDARRAWSRRRRLGRPLNLLRLLKAATTFDNAADYVAWKVERHSGYRIVPTPFQRRHPLLAAPALYWRLRRKGVLR